MNKVILIGRLTRDPELKFAPTTGTAISNFTVAVDRQYSKEGQPSADFINCVAFGKLAELVANNLTKGRLVAVVGAIQTSSYTAQDGTRRYKTEVVAEEVKFLDWAKDKQSNEIEEFREVEAEDIPF